MDQLKIGKFIARLRKEKGLTQEQFGELLGVSNRTVSRWETGRNMPDLSILKEVANCLGVPLTDLLEGEYSARKGNGEEDIEKIIDYSQRQKELSKKNLNKHIIIGLVCYALTAMDRHFGFFKYIFTPPACEFISGGLTGFGLVSLAVGIYNNNHKVSLKEKKKKLLGLRE